jgi:chromosome segregation ATPase
VGPDAILAYIRAPQISDQIKQVLQQVVTLRRQLDATTVQREQREQQIRSIAEEQQRIRQNMERLDRNASLYTRYVSKLDEQESAIETLQRDIAQLTSTEQQQRQALEDFLLGLELP